MDKLINMSDREVALVFEAMETLLWLGFESIPDVAALASDAEDELDQRDLVTDREVEWNRIAQREDARDALSG